MANAGWFRRVVCLQARGFRQVRILYSVIRSSIFSPRPSWTRSSLFLMFALPRASELSGCVPAAFAAARSAVTIFSVSISDGFHFRVSRECAWPRAKSSGIRCHGTELSMHGAPNIGQVVNLKHPHFSRFGFLATQIFIRIVSSFRFSCKARGVPTNCPHFRFDCPPPRLAAHSYHSLSDTKNFLTPLGHLQ